MRRIELFLLMIVLAMLGGWVLIGCAQNTEVPAEQRLVQETKTPTSAAQDAATLGETKTDTNVTYNYYIGSGRPKNIKGEESPTSRPTAEVEAFAKTVGIDLDTSEADAIDDWEPGQGLYIVHFADANVSAIVTSGGTTTGQEAAATGTGTAAQSPTITPTVYPVQDVKPRTGVTLQAGFAPGGVVDQQGSSSAGEGSTELAKTSTNDLKWAKLTEAIAQTPGLLDTILAFINGQLSVPVLPAVASRPSE